MISYFTTLLYPTDDFGYNYGAVFTLANVPATQMIRFSSLEQNLKYLAAEGRGNLQEIAVHESLLWPHQEQPDLTKAYALNYQGQKFVIEYRQSGDKPSGNIGLLRVERKLLPEEQPLKIGVLDPNQVLDLCNRVNQYLIENMVVGQY
jgi:hypothetical protein